MKEVHIFGEGAIVFDKFICHNLIDINALFFFSILLEKYFISLNIHSCMARLLIIIDGYHSGMICTRTHWKTSPLDDDTASNGS